jgi:hypothetical protein
MYMSNGFNTGSFNESRIMGASNNMYNTYFESISTYERNF